MVFRASLDPLVCPSNARKLRRDAARHHLSQARRHRVAKLPHGFGPQARKVELVGESLQAGALADGEVTDFPVRQREHVFTARNAVVTRFQRFRGFVQ